MDPAARFSLVILNNRIYVRSTHNDIEDELTFLAPDWYFGINKTFKCRGSAPFIGECIEKKKIADLKYVINQVFCLSIELGERIAYYKNFIISGYEDSGLSRNQL